MTKYTRAVIDDHAASEIEAALNAAIKAQGLDVPSCELRGSNKNSLVAIIVHQRGGKPRRFTVAMEDITDHQRLVAMISTALIQALGMAAGIDAEIENAQEFIPPR
jgi:hypothetical protein